MSEIDWEIRREYYQEVKEKTEMVRRFKRKATKMGLGERFSKRKGIPNWEKLTRKKRR